MHLGLTPWNLRQPSAQQLTRQAVFAEQCGYQSFWLPENHFNVGAIPDPLMLLAGVAAATEKIQLATTSYLLTLRNPLQAAEQVAVLDNLSNGRVLLGVGRGYAPAMLKAFNVVPKNKRQVFAECLDLMRQAWRGEPVDVGDGVEVTLDPLPIQQPHPPIWVAAFGPKALAQAGSLGMPYLASPMEPLDRLQDNYQTFADSCVTPVAEIPVMRSVYVSDDDREVRRLREALEKAVVPRLGEPAPVEDWAIVGSPGYVTEKIAAYQEGLGMTHLIATRLRLPNLEEAQLKTSVERLAQLLLS